MGRLSLGAAIAAVLIVMNLAGTRPALAGDGNSAKPSPPGQQQTPPGQAAKAEADPEKPTPPGQQQTPPGQAAKGTVEPAPAAEQAENHEHGNPSAGHSAPAAGPTQAHGTRRPESVPRGAEPASPATPRPGAGKPAAAAQPAKSAPAKRNPSAHEHVIICHRTGSESNPYVVINISIEGWLHGHSTHPPLHGRSDIVLKRSAEPGEKLPVSACTDPGGPGTTEPTHTTAPSQTTAPRETTAGTTGAMGDPASVPASPAGNETRDPQSRQSAASHSGAAGRLSQTAVRAKLPFTGVPLWLVMLAGTALVGGGAVLRRGRMLQVCSRRVRAHETGLFWSRYEP